MVMKQTSISECRSAMDILFVGVKAHKVCDYTSDLRMSFVIDDL